MAGDAHHAGDSLAAARLAAIVNSSDDAIVGKTVDGVVTSTGAILATYAPAGR